MERGKLKEIGSFDEVAKQYEPMIKHTIKQLRLHKGFEEMYQIGLIALWEAYEKFDPDKGHFPAYAKVVVRGRILTALKKMKGYDDRHVFPEPAVEDEDWFATIADSAGRVPLERDIVMLYMQGLSDRQQLWVEEAVLAGKTTREIAEEQGVSQNTVRTWKKEALKKMKKNLENMA